LTTTQRWVLGELLGRYQELEAALDRVNRQIREQVAVSPDPFLAEAVQLLDTIPGVGEQVAETVIAEIGVDMSRFPTSGHLASWAGMCPGNNESAGKRKSGKTNKGSPYLRAALVQAAWAASHTKGTYLSAQFRRLVRRMGKKKALVAVGHTILIIVYQVLSRRVSYRDLGGDYFDRRNVEVQRQRLIRRLESLGLRVRVEELGEAA
jgi:transposase